MEQGNVRILFLVHRFPPYVGGIPRLAFRVAEGLVSRGHDVSVYTSSHRNAARHDEVRGIKISRYDLLHPSLARLIRVPWEIMPGLLKEAIRSDEVRSADIVQTFSFFSFVSSVGSCIKIVRKKIFAIVPVALPYRALAAQDRPAQGIQKAKRLLSQFYLASYYFTAGLAVMRTADLLFPQTSLEKEMLVSSGVDPGKTRVIPAGVDVPQYSTLPESSGFRGRYSIDPDERIILFVGNPGLWKGTHHLILAMDKVSKTIPRTTLVIAGPAKNNAYQLLRRYGSSQVAKKTIITGSLEGESLTGAYSAADLLVLPSSVEGFGTVVLEAAAAGLPIVATKTGIAPEIVDHSKNGLLVEYGNIPQISNAIMTILRDDEYGTMARRKKQWVLDNYDYERVIDLYESAYLETRSSKALRER